MERETVEINAEDAKELFWRATRILEQRGDKLDRAVFELLTDITLSLDSAMEGV